MDTTNSNKDSDAYLLHQIGKGRMDAFDTLFEKYWMPAYSAAYRRLKNHEDSMDVVQEIFIHIWDKRDILSIDNLPAYLHVAIRNKVLKVMAKNKHSHPFFSLTENMLIGKSGADSHLLWKEFLRSYEILLASLPPKRQQIFRMRYDENLSTKEIASRLGIALKTVQNQLGKAVDSLKVDLHRLLAIGGLLTSML